MPPRSHTPWPRCLAALAVAAAALPIPALAAADASLAIQMGCLNCHGTPPRGDAPSFERMQQRAAQGQRDPEALATHWLEEMRAIPGIVAHRQVTDETARALGQWLAKPPNRPMN